MRAARAGAHHRRPRAEREDARHARCGWAWSTRSTRPRRRRSRGADLVILCVPVGACGAVAQADGAAPQARRHPDRRRLGQGRGRARRGPALCPRACISFPAIRSPAPSIPARIRLRRAVRRPLVHPDAAARAPTPAAVDKLAAFWRRCGATSRSWTPEHHDLVLAITSHVPHLIAYNIVNTARHLERVTDSRGDQVLGRRLPRLHPHRRLRPDHVARRVPQQQGGGAGDARPLQRGPDRAAARHPLRRRRHAVRAVRRRRARSAAASSRPARTPPAPDFGRARHRPSRRT